MKKFDFLLKFLILYSVTMYLFEMLTGTSNSYESHKFFLWSERTVAMIFTVEFLWRLVWRHKEDYHNGYSPMMWIDLLAIIPFWIGFFVPVQLLGLVRSLRVLRLLKYFRYSRGLQLVALGFYRASSQLKFLAFPVITAVIFSTVAMHEAEKLAQPEKFSSLFDTFWFTTVTVTTVGYGDMSPVTIPGKIITMITFVFVLSLFAGFIGVVGNAMSKVLEEEEDPTADPVALFKQERARRQALKTKQ